MYYSTLSVKQQQQVRDRINIDRDLVVLLLEYGAKVNAQDEDGKTAMPVAAFAGTLHSSMKHLIERICRQFEVGATSSQLQCRYLTS